MKYFIHATIGCLFAFSPTTGYSAVKTCSSLVQTHGNAHRQLFLLPSGTPLETGKSLKRQPLSLAYIVPPHAYNSGVVILKVRHRVVTTAPPAAAPQRILMSRNAYRTPCAGKPVAEMLETSYSPDIAEYRNYHLYRMPGDEIDRVHADLGNRPKGWAGDSDNRCVSTSSWDIRPQLLFEDSISERRVIGVGEYFSNRVSSSLRAAQATDTAVAAPVAYADYRELAVRIIPYRKQQNQPSCVNVSVSPVPAGANWTDLMIIDADDARYPRDPFMDPQKSWRVQWN